MRNHHKRMYFPDRTQINQFSFFKRAKGLAFTFISLKISEATYPYFHRTDTEVCTVGLTSALIETVTSHLRITGSLCPKAEDMLKIDFTRSI